MSPLILVISCLWSCFLSWTTGQSATAFCSGNVCYFMPKDHAKPWADAQRICGELNASLPIVENIDHQRSFAEAIKYFSLNTFFWIGANASYHGPNNWTWLDGVRYSGKYIQGPGSFAQSYVYVAKNSSGFAFYASSPTVSRSYICSYPITADVCRNVSTTSKMGNHCYVLYNETLQWFSARNRCLAIGGDLASFSNTSIFSKDFISSFFNLNLPILTSTSGSYWIGLRNSWWNWQNAMTGQPSEVTFSLWNSNQPDGGSPSCISTDQTDYISWRDWNCSDSSVQFICQVFNESEYTTTSYETSSAQPTSVDVAINSTFHPLTLGDVGSANSTRNLAIGIGVGVGIPVLIVLVLIAILVARTFRKKRAMKRMSNKRIKEQGEEELTEFDAPPTNSPSEAYLYASVNKNVLQSTADLVPPINNSEPGNHYAHVKRNEDLLPLAEVTPSQNSGPVYAEFDLSK